MKSRFLAAAVAVVVLGGASSAWALDAYRDRRGMLYGLTIGFGGGKSDVEGDERRIGLNGRARIGGGVSQQLTLDADVGVHHVIEDDNGSNLITGFAGANYFFIDNVYLRGMFGLSHLAPEAGDSATGIAVGGGLGYEFFANADLAIGGLVDFQQHFYDDFDFNVLSFGVTVTMY
jgi:hypothetical protein